MSLPFVWNMKTLISILFLLIAVVIVIGYFLVAADQRPIVRAMLTISAEGVYSMNGETVTPEEIRSKLIIGESGGRPVLEVRVNRSASLESVTRVLTLAKELDAGMSLTDDVSR